MKVNILGRGIIPTLKKAAPLMNVDLDINTARFILGSRNLGIYRVSDLKLITGANIDKLFAEETTPEAAAVEATPVVEETPVVEAAPVEEVAEEVVEEAPSVEEEVVEETTEEEAPVEEEVTEEVVEEEKPAYTSKKKNRKNRNNG